MFPSGPPAMSCVKVRMPGLNADTTPVGVARPTPDVVVNHTLPSGPDVIRIRGRTPCGVGNSAIPPAGVIRPMCPFSVNQTFPSGPAVIPNNNGDETGNSVNFAVATVQERGVSTAITGAATATAKPSTTSRDLPRLARGSTLRQRMKFADKVQYLRYLVD